MAGPYPEKVWFNGRIVPWQDATVHVMAHVVHYGSSVFEGIRSYDTAHGPRIFRLTRDRAMVNRMGFPNPGAAAVVPRLAARRPHEIVGINVGKTRVVADDQVEADYRASVRLLAPLADFLVLNVSSPNTPGLRDLQFGEPLAQLLGALVERRAALADRHGRRVPLALKIAPDMADEDLRSVADTARRSGIDALIATNTTVSREGVAGMRGGNETGGLSGAP